jgi:hypothetical protein
MLVARPSLTVEARRPENGRVPGCPVTGHCGQRWRCMAGARRPLAVLDSLRDDDWLVQAERSPMVGARWRDRACSGLTALDRGGSGSWAAWLAHTSHRSHLAGGPHVGRLAPPYRPATAIARTSPLPAHRGRDSAMLADRQSGVNGLAARKRSCIGPSVNGRFRSGESEASTPVVG